MPDVSPICIHIDTHDHVSAFGQVSHLQAHIYSPSPTTTLDAIRNLTWTRSYNLFGELSGL